MTTGARPALTRGSSATNRDCRRRLRAPGRSARSYRPPGPRPFDARGRQRKPDGKGEGPVRASARWHARGRGRSVLAFGRIPTWWTPDAPRVAYRRRVRTALPCQDWRAPAARPFYQGDVGRTRLGAASAPFRPGTGA